MEEIPRMTADKPEDLGQEDLARLLLDMFHRIMVHHTLWFREVEHQFGFPKALEIMAKARQSSYDVQMKRFAKTFGFEMRGQVPQAILDMPRESLLRALDDTCINWLAGDGIWFQAVESARDMNDAKRCNDSCWGRFSPFEAWSIKQFLGLPDQAGLAGLKRALQFRTYARINIQSITDEEPDSFVFRMNDCRVQSARKKKGLADYPCKSAGLVEYRTFGEAVDSRIRCECVGCPPDEHPEGWFCAWRYSLNV